VEILTLDVEYMTGGCFDEVKIHDGIDDSETLLGTFCGPPPWLRIVTSSSDALFISFQTDSIGTLGGFKIKYTTTRRCKYCLQSVGKWKRSTVSHMRFGNCVKSINDISHIKASYCPFSTVVHVLLLTNTKRENDPYRALKGQRRLSA